jgi:hypothetical protein
LGLGRQFKTSTNVNLEGKNSAELRETISQYT